MKIYMNKIQDWVDRLKKRAYAKCNRSIFANNNYIRNIIISKTSTSKTKFQKILIIWHL